MADDFWVDLDLSCALLFQEILKGEDINRLAGKLKKTESLLYKWSNPNSDKHPSFKNFLRSCKETGNRRPIEHINQAFGIAGAPYTGDLSHDLKVFLRNWENMAGVRE